MIYLTDTIPNIKHNPNTIQFVVDRIESEYIMNLYRDALKFPSTFGANWDALRDSLAYLDDWFTETTVNIYHKPIKQADNKTLETYLFIIKIFSAEWDSLKEKDVNIYFHKEDESMLAQFGLLFDENNIMLEELIFCCDKFKSHYYKNNDEMFNMRIIQNESLNSIPQSNQQKEELKQKAIANSKLTYWMCQPYNTFDFIESAGLRMHYCPFCAKDLYSYYTECKYANEIEVKTFSTLSKTNSTK